MNEITVNELRKERIKLEAAIQEAIADACGSFSSKTGIGVEYVNVDMEAVHTVGDDVKRFRVGSVDVDLKRESNDARPTTAHKSDRDHPSPEPADDGKHFYSTDAATLTAWLYAGRGPICPNDAVLVENVRTGYTGRPRGKW